MSVDQKLLKRAERGGKAWEMLPDERPSTTYYDQYGVGLRLPADPASFMVYIGKGFTLKPPQAPAEQPTSMVARDGSEIDLASMAQDDWDGKKRSQAAAPTSSAPTLTYFTREGTALPGLPADPASMAGYLAAGLSLNPPEGADMAHTTGYYYNRDGGREGPFPNWGDWPATYAARGYSETPPHIIEEDDDEPEGDALDTMGLVELKAMAASAEIDISGLRKKSEVKAAIREANALVAAAPTPDPLEELDLDELIELAELNAIDLSDVDVDSEEDVLAAIRLWREANPESK